MRPLLAGEFDTATNTDVRADVDVKVEVENGSGTFKNLRALLGYQWVANVSYGEHVNTRVSTATITLVQQIGTASLAPLIESSTLNVLDDNVTYSPLLQEGRLVRFSTATVAHGATPAAGDFRAGFEGRIDRVRLNDAGGVWAGPITIECSDLGAWLMDLQVESPGKEYGDPDAPPNLEDVLQSVIDDNLPTGDPAVTVVKQSSSTFAVTKWLQGETKVMEALGTLVLDSTGEDIRYRFNAAHASTLQWFDPDRDRVTVDATFPKETYILRTLETAIDDVRNAGALPYTDESAGTASEVTSESLASIDKYRRRFFRMPESSMLSSAAEAQAVLDHVVSDLSYPLAEAEATIPYCWFVQLFDRYTFEANGRQYTTDQTFGVVGYRHTIQNGQASTTLTLAGRVVGAYSDWLTRIKKGGAVANSLNIQSISHSEDTPYGSSRTYIVRLGSRVDTVHLYYRTEAVDVVGDAFDFSGNETVTGAVTHKVYSRVAGQNTVSFTIAHPAKGYRVFARMIPYSRPLPRVTEGESWPFYLDPAEEVALTVVAKLQATTTETVTVRVQVADPYPQGTNSATIAYTALGATVTEASGQTVTPVDTITGAAGTYFDFTVTRPAPGANGRVSFTATAAGRSPGVDAIDIPALDGIPQGSISINEDGSVAISVDGSSWVASYKYATSTSAFPSDATAIAGTTLNGRQATVSLAASTLDLGDTIYATFVPYSQAGAAGTAGSSFRMRTTRHDNSATTTTYSTFHTVTEASIAAFGTNQWQLTTDGYLQNYGWPGTYPSAVWGAKMAAILTIPSGVTLTAISTDLYFASGTSGGISVTLERISSTGSQTVIATATANTTGWQTKTASCSESTTSRNYRMLVSMSGADPAAGEHRPVDGDLRASIFSYTYTRPSTVYVV